MKKVISIFLVLLLCSYSAVPVYAESAKNTVAKSQLEVRQIQTHVFNTSNKTEVLKAAINTLQDDGYMILNIEDELGYIQARREYKAVRIDNGRLTVYYINLAFAITATALSYGADAYTIALANKRIQNEINPRTIVVNSNVTVESFGKKTKVRYTLVEKELETADGYNFVKCSPRRVVRFYSEPIYQEFFAELDKNIYYENNSI